MTRRQGPFRNHGGEFKPRSLRDVLAWRIDAARRGLPRPPLAPTPWQAADLAFLHGNAGAGAAMLPALTWLGHASSLVQLGGMTLLLDPVFSERVSPLSFMGPKRHSPPPLAIADLPRIDAVLVSHNHYDHLDDASVRALARQPGGPPRFIVPLGLASWLAQRGIADAVELDWWETTRLGALEIVATPARHWSGRGLFDRMATLWCGFAIFAADFQLFYSGDTGASRDPADIHQRFAARHGGDGRGFDLAVLPIGAYAPRWFMREQHVDQIGRAHV